LFFDEHTKPELYCSTIMKDETNGMANQQSNDEGMRELALFAGAGGGILGGKLLGWRTVCAVEWDAYAASVLVARQNDGCLEAFPVWDDCQKFDGRPWRGLVDVVSGGFPCTDISCAGKGAGIDGEASGMWKHMARIVGEVRPRFVFVENSPMLTIRGLGRVLGDLASMGYDTRWGVIAAGHIGGSHLRERIWILANSKCRDVQKSQLQQRIVYKEIKEASSRYMHALNHVLEWPDKDRISRGDDGIPNSMDRIKAIGNAQVPAVAATAWKILGGI
jgi:DNA (cytosine-5)-methyltransferase 1